MISRYDRSVGVVPETEGAHALYVAGMDPV